MEYQTFKPNSSKTWFETKNLYQQSAKQYPFKPNSSKTWFENPSLFKLISYNTNA